MLDRRRLARIGGIILVVSGTVIGFALAADPGSEGEGGPDKTAERQDLPTRAEGTREVGTAPIGILTVHEDGSFEFNPLGTSARRDDSSDVAGPGVIRPIDPQASVESPVRKGEVPVNSVDPQIEPPVAAGPLAVRSVDPLQNMDSVETSDSSLTVRSVDPMQAAEPTDATVRFPISGGLRSIHSGGLPDLIASSCSASCNPSTDLLDVSVTVQNQGSGDAGPFETGVYASTNSIISTSDTRIGFCDHAAGLPAGASIDCSGSLTASGVTPGTYFVGFYADDTFQVGESDGSNNTCVDGQWDLPCSNPLPDLIASSCSASCNPSTDLLDVSVTVQNQGSGDAGPFETGVYASTNSTISTSDTRIGFCDHAAGLPAGASIDCSGSLTASGVTPGTYFVGFYADDTFQVGESDGSNNTCVDGQWDLPCAPSECNPACGKANIECLNPGSEYDNRTAVARLLRDGEPWCTAWIIGSPDCLLTNRHCITVPGTGSHGPVDDVTRLRSYCKTLKLNSVR